MSSLPSLADLADEYELLDSEDRYRLLIDLGRALEPMPDPLKTDATLVRGEQRRLMQVVLNLVSNAIKYTKQGGSVTIATRKRPDSGLELSVRDTGCDIDTRDLAVVMQPFGQIDNPYNRINQGTGLGLPLARRLVELHDGRLLLESRIGIGTTAIVTLPPDRVIDPVELGSIA